MAFLTGAVALAASANPYRGSRLSGTWQGGGVRWDDVQLLKLIDELEESEQPSHLWNGTALFQKATEGQAIAWGRDETPFARELLLSCRAGYIEWDDRMAPKQQGLAPLDVPPLPVFDLNRPTTAMRQGGRSAPLDHAMTGLAPATGGLSHGFSF